MSELKRSACSGGRWIPCEHESPIQRRLAQANIVCRTHGCNEQVEQKDCRKDEKDQVEGIEDNGCNVHSIKPVVVVKWIAALDTHADRFTQEGKHEQALERRPPVRPVA
eukprot:1121088-Prymnesium_polylepis.1